jgi:hypothetical protein
MNIRETYNNQTKTINRQVKTKEKTQFYHLISTVHYKTHRMFLYNPLVSNLNI